MRASGTVAPSAVRTERAPQPGGDAQGTEVAMGSNPPLVCCGTMSKGHCLSSLGFPISDPGANKTKSPGFNKMVFEIPQLLATHSVAHRRATPAFPGGLLEMQNLSCTPDLTPLNQNPHFNNHLPGVGTHIKV